MSGRPSTWGEAVDASAARQLGLEPGDHAIRMMASGIDYLEPSDLGDIGDGEEWENASADEVIREVVGRIKVIDLPPGYRMVGMVNLDDRANVIKYGIVNLTEFGFK